MGWQKNSKSIMIAPQELRQNNLLEYPGWNKDGTPKYFRVRDIFWEDNNIGLTDGIIHVPKTKLDNLKPIELTEDWLFKLGFERHMIPDFLYKQILNDWTRIYFNPLHKICELSINGHSAALGQITCVHQLQNLFYVLGEELKIKE